MWLVLQILLTGAFTVPRSYITIAYALRPLNDKEKQSDALVPWSYTSSQIRMTKKNLSLYCIDCDWGVGVIRRGKTKLFPLNKNLDFKFLEKNRKELLNLISVKKFIKY